VIFTFPRAEYIGKIAKRLARNDRLAVAYAT
jgi:hypothetical protein